MTAPHRQRGFWHGLRHAFAIPAERSLSPEEERWLEQIADRVVRRRLAAPAVLLLEAVKPVGFVGSQVVAFFRPLISTVVRPESCDRVIELLERRGTPDMLARMIEEREDLSEARRR